MGIRYPRHIKYNNGFICEALWYPKEDKMHHDPSMLIAAVSKALGRKLDKNRFNDRLIMQKGCYILNRWGYGPEYRYGLYIRGPYSSELADDYYGMEVSNGPTDVPNHVIDELSGILKKGIGYTEAYATVLLVKENNPTRDNETIMNKALSIKPRLKSEVMEACSSILT